MRISSVSISHMTIGFFSIGVAFASYRFLLLGLENAFQGMELHIEVSRTVFLLHVIFAPVALAAGVFQFNARLRARMPAFHRWLGRVYAFAILVSGFAGLALAIGSTDRPFAASGFGLLAVLWMGSTARAVFLAMNGRFPKHRVWMIRSFALTFAAVTLRLQLLFFMSVLGMDYLEASDYLAWTCWVPNMLIAEWLAHKPSQLLREKRLPA